MADLRQRFKWAMDLSLESYDVLPDGRSFARSDEDERAIGIFENLLGTLDAVPPSLMRSAGEQRSASPGLFDEALERSIQAVGYGFSPATATAFVEALNAASKMTEATLLLWRECLDLAGLLP
jgi:hypothetical protein